MSRTANRGVPMPVNAVEISTAYGDGPDPFNDAGFTDRADWGSRSIVIDDLPYDDPTSRMLGRR